MISRLNNPLIALFPSPDGYKRLSGAGESIRFNFSWRMPISKSNGGYKPKTRDQIFQERRELEVRNRGKYF
jgi:hypothetical protein